MLSHVVCCVRTVTSSRDASGSCTLTLCTKKSSPNALMTVAAGPQGVSLKRSDFLSQRQ